MSDGIQGLCEKGQEALVNQQYVDAEQYLVLAEREALAAGDWDALARLYMPLQEARRQRRQRTCEGVICLNLLSEGPDDVIEGRHVIENYPHGQLLVAGWATLEPALQVRRLQGRFKLYLDVFLAAKYPLIGGGHAVVIVPHEHVVLPAPAPRRMAEMAQSMPPRSIILREEDIPAGPMATTTELTALTQSWWERLHTPFLQDARETKDPRKRIEAYRRTIRVDYACEFAHQELANTAREMARQAIASHR